MPIAFVSEHSETLVELDVEYKKLAKDNGCKHYNCKHQRYYGTRMRELIFEREVIEWYYGPFEMSGFYWSKEEEEWDKDSETLHDFGVKELYDEMYSDNWYITMQDGLELIEEVLRDLKAFNSLSKADEQCMKRFIECVEKQIWTTT